jgi:hypothetical protein
LWQRHVEPKEARASVGDDARRAYVVSSVGRAADAFRSSMTARDTAIRAAPRGGALGRSRVSPPDDGPLAPPRGASCTPSFTSYTGADADRARS